MSSLPGRFHPSSNAARLCTVIAAGMVPFLLASCSRETADRAYVARVGSARLSEVELRQSIDTLGVSARAVRDIVNEWIINELLYQEAARRGIADSESIQRQLNTTRRALSIAALLGEELYAPEDTAGIGDERVAAYLKRAPAEFTLREDVALASYVLTGDRESASSFRAMLLAGTSWTEALSRFSADSVLAPRLRQVSLRQFVTQGTLYPQELWRLARALSRNEVSFVVPTDAGHAVFSVHEIRRQGEAPDPAYVRDEVRDRILIELRQARYESLISRLRSSSTVELRLAVADTAARLSEEP